MTASHLEPISAGPVPKTLIQDHPVACTMVQKRCTAFSEIIYVFINYFKTPQRHKFKVLKN